MMWNLNLTLCQMLCLFVSYMVGACGGGFEGWLSFGLLGLFLTCMTHALSWLSFYGRFNMRIFCANLNGLGECIIITSFSPLFAWLLACMPHVLDLSLLCECVTMRIVRIIGLFC